MRRKKDWRDLAIPRERSNAGTVDYHKVRFDRAHPLAAEPLVDCAAAGLHCSPFYARDDGLNFPYRTALRSAPDRIYLRQSVVRLLLEVNQALRPYAVELCLLDGHRCVETQSEIWNFYCKWAAARNPRWTQKQVDKFAAKFASDPRRFDPHDWTSWPVHSTGGAVDLTLIALASRETIFMGGIFDDPSPVSTTTYFETAKPKETSASQIVALRYRRLLYHAMTSKGFENYPAEWWHFDWGTQMWALRAGRKGRPRKAFYGYKTDAADGFSSATAAARVPPQSVASRKYQRRQ